MGRDSGDHDDPASKRRLVGAALGGAVFVAEVGSTSIGSASAEAESPEPWATVDTPIAAVTATGSQVLVVSGDGRVTGLAPDGARLVEVAPLVDAAEAVADVHGVWVLSSDRRSLAHVELQGRVDRRLAVDRVERLGAALEGVWYTGRGDPSIRRVSLAAGHEVRIPLTVENQPHGGLVGCGNSVWMSVSGGLVWSPERDGELRHMRGGPEGPVDNLICAGTALIGGDDLEGMFILDFAADDSLRPLITGRTGRIDALTTDGRMAWALCRLPDGAPAAVRLRGGRR